jgi:hypothetical protein
LGNEQQRKGAKKVVLAEWISKALGRALISENIQSGFRATGIYSLNSHAMDSKMGPSTVYEDAGPDIDALSQEVQTLNVEEVMEEDIETLVNSGTSTFCKTTVMLWTLPNNM